MSDAWPAVRVGNAAMSSGHTRKPLMSSRKSAKRVTPSARTLSILAVSFAKSASLEYLIDFPGGTAVNGRPGLTLHTKSTACSRATFAASAIACASACGYGVGPLVARVGVVLRSVHVACSA